MQCMDMASDIQHSARMAVSQPAAPDGTVLSALPVLGLSDDAWATADGGCMKAENSAGDDWKLSGASAPPPSIREEPLAVSLTLAASVSCC